MVVKALTLAPKIAHFVASSSSWSVASKLPTRKTSRSVPLPPSALLTPAHLEMVHRNGVKTSDSPENLDWHFPRRLISHETPHTQWYDIPIYGPMVNVLHSLYGFLSTWFVMCFNRTKGRGIITYTTPLFVFSMEKASAATPKATQMHTCPERMLFVLKAAEMGRFGSVR